MNLMNCFLKKKFWCLAVLWGFFSSFGNAQTWLFKHEWTAAQEMALGEFVRSIGESNCESLVECLEQQALSDDIPNDLQFFSEALNSVNAPFVIKAYFAYRKKLPFSWVDAHIYRSGIDPQLNSEEPALPYRRRMVQHSEDLASVAKDLKKINFGVYQTYPSYEGFAKDLAVSDFYSSELSARAIQPGTLLFDRSGKVAMVYEVAESGLISLLEVAQNGKIHRRIFASRYSRPQKDIGGGFLNWRPMIYENSRIRAWGNSEISEFALSQYTHDLELPFYQMVRQKLSVTELEELSPLIEFEVALKDLCWQLQERSEKVNQAISDKIYLKAHPERLPENVIEIGSRNDWAAYSSLFLDLRFKKSFLELRNFVESVTDDFFLRAGGIVDSVEESLEYRLFEKYKEIAPSCSISYINSSGEKKLLSLEEVEARLKWMSFDPFHCPEKRWGATPEESQACSDDSEKEDWYIAQRGMRMMTELDPSVSYHLPSSALDYQLLSHQRPVAWSVGTYLAQIEPDYYLKFYPKTQQSQQSQEKSIFEAYPVRELVPVAPRSKEQQPVRVEESTQSSGLFMDIEKQIEAKKAGEPLIDVQKRIVSPAQKIGAAIKAKGEEIRTKGILPTVKGRDPVLPRRKGVDPRPETDGSKTTEQEEEPRKKQPFFKRWKR